MRLSDARVRTVHPKCVNQNNRPEPCATLTDSNKSADIEVASNYLLGDRGAE